MHKLPIYGLSHLIREMEVGKTLSLFYINLPKDCSERFRNPGLLRASMPCRLILEVEWSAVSRVEESRHT